jgi:hypothetical protein
MSDAAGGQCVWGEEGYLTFSGPTLRKDMPTTHTLGCGLGVKLGSGAGLRIAVYGGDRQTRGARAGEGIDPVGSGSDSLGETEERDESVRINDDSFAKPLPKARLPQTKRDGC